MVVERSGDRSRCTELRSDPPLTLRETATGLHLVASSAGPLGGDELGLSVRVGAGAHLDLRSVAASMAHPSPRGETSHLGVEIDVAEGGSLRWTPQPTILVRACDHRATTRVRLATGAVLVWRDEVVLGRREEPSGSLLQRLLVDGPSGPLLRNDLAVGPRWPGSLGPAGVGADARAVGTVLLVGHDSAGDSGPLPHIDGVRWARSPLGARDDAVLITAVATEGRRLAAALDHLVAVD